jgi:hypothetical protein
MTAGPFEGLEPLGRARMVARALVGCGPRDLDQLVHWRLVYDAVIRSEPGLLGQWIGGRSPAGERYVRIADGGGESRDALPAGERAAVMLESPESFAVREWLARFGAAYAGGTFGPPSEATVGALKNTVMACAPDFDAALLDLLAANPDPMRLLEAWEERYLEYAFGATFLGHVRAVGAIGAWPEPPYESARALLDRAVAASDEASLLDLGTQWRDAVDDATEQARAAPDAETALETIYRALPTAAAAVALYRALGRERVASAVEERRVRMRHALAESILDFSGRRWRELQSEIARSGGEALARSLTEHHLLYPRVLLPALLAGTASGPGFTPQGEDMVERMLLAAVLGDQPDVREGVTSEPFAQPTVPVRPVDPVDRSPA